MMKRKKVLIIGNPEATTMLLHGLYESCDEITYCYGDIRAIESAKQNGEHFDLIIVGTEGLDEKDTVLAQCLAAMDPVLDDPPSHRCGVELLPDGSYQLHCCLRPSLNVSNGMNNHGSGRQVQGYAFEYQAPIKKTG